MSGQVSQHPRGSRSSDRPPRTARRQWRVDRSVRVGGSAQRQAVGRRGRARRRQALARRRRHLHYRLAPTPHPTVRTRRRPLCQDRPATPGAPRHRRRLPRRRPVERPGAGHRRQPQGPHRRACSPTTRPNSSPRWPRCRSADTAVAMQDWARRAEAVVGDDPDSPQPERSLHLSPGGSTAGRTHRPPRRRASADLATARARHPPPTSTANQPAPPPNAAPTPSSTLPPLPRPPTPPPGRPPPTPRPRGRRPWPTWNTAAAQRRRRTLDGPPIRWSVTPPSTASSATAPPSPSTPPRHPHHHHHLFTALASATKAAGSPTATGPDGAKPTTSPGSPTAAQPPPPTWSLLCPRHHHSPTHPTGTQTPPRRHHRSHHPHGRTLTSHPRPARRAPPLPTQRMTLRGMPHAYTAWVAEAGGQLVGHVALHSRAAALTFDDEALEAADQIEVVLRRSGRPGGPVVRHNPDTVLRHTCPRHRLAYAVTSGDMHDVKVRKRRMEDGGPIEAFESRHLLELRHGPSKVVPHQPGSARTPECGVRDGRQQRRGARHSRPARSRARAPHRRCGPA